MSIATLTWTRGVRDLPAELDCRWQTAAPATRLRWQLGTFTAVALIAYHYSLSSLVANVDLSTPLAYIGLVPGIAFALAAARARPLKREPAIHDRQLDYIVGLPLIAAAGVINILLPYKYSDLFWVWRLDLVSFPLFVAGAIALIFGTRVLWRQKLAVSYLLLAWPLPYSFLLLSVLSGFTNLTVDALRSMLQVVHVASFTNGSGGELFNVVHGGSSFQLSVVSACSGVDSVVGFLLVGSAFGALVTGPRLLKLIWLAGGMLLLWVQNLGRIVFIFWAGKVWGEHVAISILHPFVGLLTFSVSVLVMIMVMGSFRLRINIGVPPNDAEKAARRTPGPGQHLAVKSFYPVAGFLAAVALLLGANNTGLRQFNLVADSSGEAKLASYSANPAKPPGWDVYYQTSYTWAQPYFGDGSTWLRYQYAHVSGGNLSSNLPITADVVNTTNLESFSAYSVQACYNFHGYTIKDVANVSLGGGIRGQALSFAASTNGDWTIVYWLWPVKDNAATSATATHYERVILYIQNTPQTQEKAPGLTTGITNVSGSLNPASAADERLLAERTYIVDFAREVVRAQAEIKPGSKFVRSEANIPLAPVGSGAGNSTVNKRSAVQLPAAFLNLKTNAERQAYKRAHPEQFVPKLIGNS